MWKMTALRGHAGTVRAMSAHKPVTEMVAIDSLDVRRRLRPAAADHVRILADVLDRTPPVLVLSKGRRVLDGFMRLDA
ncbi:MAG: hypothetical protein JWO67_521, partial [Streptosporangiaceae bacterium]|nr:hypothetical protein [Streptosporangiaceae bacterium]